MFSGDVGFPDVDGHCVSCGFLSVEVLFVELSYLLFLFFMEFGLLFYGLLDGVLYKLQRYIHVFMEFLVHFEEFYETAGESLHLFLSELKYDHVSDDYQHLV